MRFKKLPSLVLCFTLFSLFQAPPSVAIKQSYIVYLGSHSHGPEITTADLDRVTESHHELLGSFLGGTEKAGESIFYSYQNHVNGFAAILEEEEAAKIAKHPDVVSVLPNKGIKLHTTHSWDFMLLDKNGVTLSDSAWKRARFGEDTIIANLDSGVWPESESFGDEGYAPVPLKWRGSCQNNTKEGVPCNRKLIGAKCFHKGYAAYVAQGNLPGFIGNTARDYIGHGSHTLSTAGGNFVPGVNVFGAGNGTASGGSPKARVAAYKVCWPTFKGIECFGADILKAFDEALYDGVDVISVSLGGPTDDYFNDPIAIGAFHAIKRGVVVVCSAGNNGPEAGSVTNVAPWIITVGASTMDREFHNFVGVKNGKRFKGTSLSQPLPDNKMYPLITGEQAKLGNVSAAFAMFCSHGTLDHTKVKGKILVCLRGQTKIVDRSLVAYLAGAAGIILCNDRYGGNNIAPDIHFLPASRVTYKDGAQILAYINSSRDPLGFITQTSTKFDAKPAPMMADFSSVGPNTITPGILKPDITAPGVNIMAAYSQAVGPTVDPEDKRRFAYNIMSGTSMACPHVSGVVGLLKTLYPHWSPAAIRSAIMTTTTVRDNTMKAILDASFNKATPFNYGAGHIRPNRAIDPGLVYDLTNDDYLYFLCTLGYNETLLKAFSRTPYTCTKQSMEIWNLNYPSITIHKLSGSVTLTRKLKNVGSPGKYAARVREPVGISVSIDPNALTFTKLGEEKSFNVTLKAKRPHAASDNYSFGRLTWTDGKHYVRSPIVVDNLTS